MLAIGLPIGARIQCRQVEGIRKTKLHVVTGVSQFDRFCRLRAWSYPDVGRVDREFQNLAARGTSGDRRQMRAKGPLAQVQKPLVTLAKAEARELSRRRL